MVILLSSRSVKKLLSICEKHELCQNVVTLNQASAYNACCITVFSFLVFILNGKTLQTTITLGSGSQIQELELKKWEGKTEKIEQLVCFRDILSVPCEWLSRSTVNLATVFIQLHSNFSFRTFSLSPPPFFVLCLQPCWTIFCSSGFLHSCPRLSCRLDSRLLWSESVCAYAGPYAQNDPMEIPGLYETVFDLANLVVYVVITTIIGNRVMLLT